MNKRILVTGGLGFIGSHTVVELQNEGFDVVVIDNLSNSSEEVLQGIAAISGKEPIFERFDLRDRTKVEGFFNKYRELDGVIHFAASKAVGESVKEPLLYYENNLAVLTYLLQGLKQRNKANFIFSSSCTVYGQAKKMPITEDTPLQAAESPYGNTKQVGEEILRDSCHAYPHLSVISLRYFNPIGAHSSAKIGELPIGAPQNLVPYITQTAIGVRECLSVFGDSYPTHDGTCIRDYIHVVDLAKAHVAAMRRLLAGTSNKGFEVFNLGTGKGSSVLEVISEFERVTGQSLKYVIAPKRDGDVTSAYADTTKANEVLGWKAELSLGDALSSAWNWEQVVRSRNK